MAIDEEREAIAAEGQAPSDFDALARRLLDTPLERLRLIAKANGEPATALEATVGEMARIGRLDVVSHVAGALTTPKEGALQSAIDRRDWARVARLATDLGGSAPDAITWLTTEDIFAPVEAVPWVCRDLQIGPGRPTLWSGYGSSAKTLSLQAMALSLSAGLSVFGQYSVRGPIRVRHMDKEQGKRPTKRRYHRLAVGLGITKENVFDNLQLACFPGVSLADPGSEETFKRVADGFDLIILDSLRAFIPGIDENDSKVREPIDRLTRVSEQLGTAWILTHHSGKPKESHEDSRTAPRGSSAIFDACGAVFLLSGADGKPRKVQQTKPSAEAEGGNVESFYLDIEDIHDEHGHNQGVKVKHMTSQQASKGSTPAERFEVLKASVLEFITKSPGHTSSAVVERIGKNRNAAFQAIKELVADGGVMKHPGGGLHGR